MKAIAKCACGAEPNVQHTISDVWVYCSGGCGWSGPFAKKESEAVDLWNRVMASIWITKEWEE